MASYKNKGYSDAMASQMLLGAVNSHPVDEMQRLQNASSAIDSQNTFSAKELLIPKNTAFKAKYDEITKRGAIGDLVAGSVNVHDKITQSLAEATNWGIKSATGIDSVTQGVYERQARKRLLQEQDLQQVGEAAGVHPSLLYALPEIATSIAPVARLGVLKGASMASTVGKTAGANYGAEFAVSKLLGETNENAMWNAIGAAGIMAPIGAISHGISGASKAVPEHTPETLPATINQAPVKDGILSSMLNTAKEKTRQYSNDFKNYAKGVDERFRTYSTKDHPVDGAEDALDVEVMSDSKYKQAGSDAYTATANTISDAFEQAKQFVADTSVDMKNFDINGFASHIKQSVDDIVSDVSVRKPDVNKYVDDIVNAYDDLKDKMNPSEFVSMAKGYMEQSLYRANNLDDFTFSKKLDGISDSTKSTDSLANRAFNSVKSSYSKLDSFISDGVKNGTIAQDFKNIIADKIDSIFKPKKDYIDAEVVDSKKMLPEADGFANEPSSLGSKLGQEANLKRKIELAKDEIKTFRNMDKEGKIEKITSQYFDEITEANANQVQEFRNALDNMHTNNPEAFKEMENAFIGEKEYKLAEHKAQLKSKYEKPESGKAKEAEMTALERRKLKRKSQDKKESEASAKQEAVDKAKAEAKKEMPKGSNKIDHSVEDAEKAKHQRDLQREVEQIKKREEHESKKSEARAEQIKADEAKKAKEEEIKARKYKDADVDSTSYAISTKDLADVKSAKGNIGIDDATKSLDEATVAKLQKASEDSFTAPAEFKFLSDVYAKYKGYFNPDDITSHVKGVHNAKEHARMIATYMHESLHQAIRKGKVDIESIEKLFKDSDFSFTGNKVYEQFGKTIQVEEELVHYSAMKASMRYMKQNGIDSKQFFNDATMAKYNKIDELVKSNQKIQDIASELDYLLFHGSTRKGSFLNDFMYGKKDVDNAIANTMFGIDKKLSSKLPKLKQETIDSIQNQTVKNFLGGLDESATAKELDDIIARKKVAENEAVVASTAIRDHIHTMIPKKEVRVSMTNHVLRTDYQAINGIKTRADAVKLVQRIDLALSKALSPTEFARLSEMTKHLAYGMNGELTALNSPMMLSNALAIAKRAGIKNITDDMIKDIDKKITIQALELANKKSGGETWKFIEANADKKWFKESIDLIKYKNELSKDMFFSNKMNYNKGYSKESYSSPYIYKLDEYGNTTKTLDNDLTYAEGAIPVESLKTKGSQVFDVPEHMKNATEEAKEAYALAKQFGVVLDTNGNISKFRKHLLSKEGKMEAGLENDFSDVLADTFSGIVKKKGLDHDFIPSIKKSIEDGKSSLMSNTKKEGFVAVSDDIKKLLPYELQDTINFVKPEYEQMLLGNIEVGYAGKNDLARTAQAILKDTVSNFKENVVLKNPVSWVNAMMFNVSIGLQHGIPMKFMTRNMREGVKAYSQMRDIQHKLFLGVANGTLSKAEQVRLQSILDNNLLYQLNKEGMTMTIAAEITSHPAFSKRLMDRMAFDRLKAFVGEEQAEKISTIWKNVYLHPHSKTGQFAIDTMTKIDVMGRYALAKHKMAKEGMSAKEAAKFANSQFGDFNKVLPIWIQYVQEFGAIPFAGWFFRVAAGLGKSAIDNPAKTIALTAGLYALQQSTGERTESWSPIMTLATAPAGMVTMSPYLHPESTAQKSKVPELYSKAYKAVETGDVSRVAISPSF